MKRVVHGVGVVLLILPALTACGANTQKPGSTPKAVIGSPITGLRGIIVFTRAGGQFGDETIFTATARDLDERQVNESGGSCCPRISPDGTQILTSAAATDGRATIAIYPTAGGQPEPVALPGSTLNLGPGSWSADGKQLSFEGWDDDSPNHNGIYIGAASGELDAHQVTKAPAGDHDVPMDFSPDGKRLIFLRVPTSSDTAVGSLYVVGVDGSGLRRVTPASVQPAYAARWSPDGTEIVFATAYWTKPASPVLIIHPDGSGMHALFTDPGGRAATTPTWSPDGKYIMFALTPMTGDRHPINDLDVIRADGTGLTRIVSTTDFKRLPDWVAG